MRKNRFATVILSLLLCTNTLVSATGKTTPKPSSSPSVTQKATSSPNAEKKSGESSSKKDSDESETQKKASFPVPNAEAAIVLDANSGDVIYALDSDKKMYPAGTSNIMTAIIALENSNLADVCTVSKEALSNVTYDQPQLGMLEGEEYTVEQLLYAIILNSNNDAANTLAITVSGSIEAFVQKMNEKAAELGMSNTNFVNPTGLHNENHYTTAEDLAKLAKYAMKNPSYAKIASTQKYVFPATNLRSQEKTILSTNHLVSRYKYPYHYYANATGIKSGNSNDAGYCLAASAVKGKMNIISIIMGAKNEDAKDKAYSFVDTKAIFDYVFENYQTILLAKHGDVVHDSKVDEAKNSTRLALTVDEDVYVTMKKTADPDIITNEVNLTSETKAPIKQGDLFGTITYSYNGRELKTMHLIAANEVKRDFILHVINSVLGFIFHPIVLIILILIIAGWVRLRIVRNRKRRIRHSRMVSYSGNGAARSAPRRSRPTSSVGSSSSSSRRTSSNYTRRRR